MRFIAMLEKRSKQGLLQSENKIGGNLAFSEITKLQSEIIAIYCYIF